MRLDNINARGTEWLSKEQVLHIRSPHALAQVIGKLKFTGGPEQKRVLFRGQSSVYASMLPSIYRPNSHIQSVRRDQADAAIKSYIRECIQADAFLRGTPEFAMEPLLQHYGVRTRWLDVVDNIWIALWFGCYNTITTGVEKQYWSIERRSRSASGFAYIAIFALDQIPNKTNNPGCSEGVSHRLIDLRVSAPSLFFRPHAQHGLLFRRSGPQIPNWEDLSDLVVGVLRISISDALDWLGVGDLLSTHTLFPSPIYDVGYKILLDKAPLGNNFVSSVAYVGP